MTIRVNSFLFFLLFLTLSLIARQYSTSPLRGDERGFTLLNLAAHPDDEDGTAIAYYSKIKNVKTYTVFFTRGEGGQNEIGPELYDELGKIRERECYDAAEILGSTPLFLGFLDFGYSKTAKETFKFWGGKDSVLEQLVYMIRVLRPGVIITNHDTITAKPKRQHGNHQAVGITAYEAFDKAADPNYHPEQFKDGVTPWQVKKLFFRFYDSAKTNGIVTIDAYRKDPQSGKTIEDIYYDALSKHRTQGLDKIVRTHQEPRYELIRSDKDYSFDKSDLFSGINPDSLTTRRGGLFIPDSYAAIYEHRKLNPDDSLKILKSIIPSLEGCCRRRGGSNPIVGVVKTYDNTVESILQAFGVKYRLLDSLDLSIPALDGLAVILLDLRAYFYRDDLRRYNSNLLKFVRDGGSVICFYNKPSDWNNKNYSPYPIYLTSERVTEEDAPVKIMEPGHPFFNAPIKITDEDWKDWIQERNIYLPSDDTNLTSSRFRRLVDMDDEGEDQPPTSILSAAYGKGNYTYASLALYRQLKIFNPGALKLFINMISYSCRD